MTAASGSAGGVTASRNRGGMYFRARAIPTNPNTALQQAVRQNLGLLANVWSNTLTGDQQAGWNLYASNVPVIDTLGASMKLSGINMFIRTNTVNLQAGGEIVANAPTIFNLGPTPTIGTITQTLGVVTVAYSPTINVGDRLAYYVGRPQNASINFFRGPYQYNGVLTTAVPEFVLNNGTGWTTGQQIFIRCQTVTSDGRLSQQGQGSFILA